MRGNFLFILAAIAGGLTCQAQDKVKPVTVVIHDWPDYFSAIEPEWQKLMKKNGLVVTPQYVTPGLSDAPALLNKLGSGGVDFVTPPTAFFRTRPQITGHLAEIDLSELPNRTKLPTSVFQLAPSRTAGKLSCVPIYGGSMNLYIRTEKLKGPVSFASFELPMLKGKYALPAKEPWYIAHIAHELLKTPPEARTSVATMKSPAFREKYKSLIKNAGYLYPGESLKTKHFDKVDLIYGWGYHLPDEFKKFEVYRTGYFLECLGITKEAAKDPVKKRIFLAFIEWFYNLDNQDKAGSFFFTFNLLARRMEVATIYPGLKDDELATLNQLHAEATAGK